jgi:hypothetical protein
MTYGKWRRRSARFLPFAAKAGIAAFSIVSIQHWQRQHSALAAAAFSIGSGSIQH